ncbi:hypothetical protein, conserved [Eimeria praecox]|uniref:EGF-like domain-containing protein n=1 Tax=Eimeria praecox TaxID=51316 RepID=U6GLR7_9EIME|nr:hypothetical protein, conserved [Eimeria praecox]
MILEEDWASCPVLLPQPRWGEGVRRKAESPYTCTDADAKSLKLTHWAVCPPASASQYSGTLFKIASDNHRSALASMSRNVAASLALLRLPAAANCCHFKYPGNSLPVQGKPDTDCISGTCSVKSGGSAYESLMSQRSVADEGQQAKEGADAQLCGVLHLILQHLRVASEEGQKLESSLRLTGEKAEHLKTCDNARRSDHVPFKPSEMEAVSDETEQLQQPVVGEPVQCLEVYTAVGQECITNRRRFQEEESLREAFADDDPAVRERSQMTLAELEQKLKKKEKERQCIPRVLKELSIIACDKADGSECGKAEDRAVVRVVSASSSEDGGFSSAAQSPGRISTSLGEGADDLLEKAAPLFTSAGGDDVNARGVAQQGFLGSPPVHAENIVLEAASQQEEACTLPYLETLDNDQVAFRIHQQKLKGCSARNVSFSPETIAAQSLISQLRSVLKRQKRTPLEGQDLLPFTAASSAVTSGSNGSSTFGDSIVDDEWSACDVVEGPNCTAEAPTWVAAPTDLGDNGADGLNGKDECSLEYCEGGSTCKSSGPEVEACSCQNETGSLCLH